ncbi:hypothetical protein [Micromonospora sp. NPDC005806]|uniref:hypothetical protein n=1 Tax=Micromonospora sp. NPDC005806 TaxID=3364234 RepID=UPI0036C6E67A
MTVRRPARPGSARRSARWRDDTGSVSTEIVLSYVPLMVLATVAIVACLRLVSANLDVNAAAAAAARQASLARSPAAAAAGGQDAAAATLQGRDITCSPRTITVDAGALAPGGQVAITVTCTVALQDLYGLGLPGTVRITGTARQPVDTYIGEQQP